jgi:VIT1/CCC1 family predicted Fe2+/Mn2+ transporter
MEIPDRIKAELIRIQSNELKEYYVYSYLAEKINDSNISKVLQRIGREELAHANFWRKYTGVIPKVSKIAVFFYRIIALVFGLTFSLKLMEKAEQNAQKVYEELTEYIPEAEKIAREEDSHENDLINMIDEDKLKYAGAIVLGLNDALVELTGALAGLTFALQNTHLIAIVGLITGIAASFSMSASSYLSSKAEGEHKDYVKSAIYTGVAYILTVVLLVLPYFIVTNPFFALIFTICIGILIIFFFNFYLSVSKDLSFRGRFFEMVLLNVIITGITFFIGYGIRQIFGIEV